MTTSAPVEPWERKSVWIRYPALLDRGVVIVTGLASLTELTRLLWLQQGIGGFAALAVTVAGAFLSRSRAWPGLVLCICGPLIAELTGWDPMVTWTICVFTVFSLTLHGLSPVRSGAVAGIAVYLSEVYFQGNGWVEVTALAAVLSVWAAAASGSAVRANQKYWSALEQRTRDAIATREIEANRRVAEERLRIARDLHDVVGHQVAVVSMHLGVAEVSLPPGSESALTALAAARTGVQAVLLETQRILDVLRTGDTDDDAGTQPAAGVEGIPALVESYRAIGLNVRATVGDLTGQLDPTVSTAAFRIVQEALTNAHRYGAGRVDLDVTVDAGVLTIHAANSRKRGQPTEDRRAGYGLAGMRERASSAGGHLLVGGDDHRFTVTATLPTNGKTHS